jgi:hypothetical protein
MKIIPEKKKMQQRQEYGITNHFGKIKKNESARSS